MSSLFDDFPRVVMDSSPNVIYILDSRLRIVYCNPAWDKFALCNGGERATAAHVTGRVLFDFITPALHDFYESIFAQCRTGAHSMAFDFECSSPDVYRLLRMEVLPLRRADGFATITSLHHEGSHDRTPHTPGRRYTGTDGIIVMCAHCRRTRRSDFTEQWDWVPQYLSDPSG